MSARYETLQFGVYDRQTSALITPGDPGWNDYLIALQTPGNVDPMPAVPKPIDREYYRKAGEAQQARRLSKLSDADFIATLRSKT